ncbi:MAG: ABC transporter ATP-binding protein [Trichlorobacter sp.]
MHRSFRELASLYPYVKGLRWRYRLGALLLVIANSCAMAIPWLMQQSIDGMRNPAAGIFSPVVAAMSIVGVAACYAVVRIYSRTVLFNAARLIEFQLRDAMLARLVAIDSRRISQGTGADVLSRFSNDLSNLRMLLGFGGMSIINALVVYGAALYLMLRIDGILTILAIAPLPVMVLATRGISQRIFQVSLAAQQGLGEITAFCDETIRVVRLFKSYGRESMRETQFSLLSASYLDHNLALGRLRGFIMPITALATGVSMVTVVLVGGRAVSSGTMSLGQFVAFTGYLALLVWPTAMLGWILTLIQRGAASMSRINEVLTAEPAITDSPTAVPLARGGIRISFENVSVELGGREVLSGITCEIPAGSRVGITGPVGSGKTTLLRVLMRLVPLNNGAVLLNGQPLEQFTISSLREQVGYVPQDAQLFSRTIAENIRYGGERPLVEVLEQAGLDQDVQHFPAGTDTLIGERGITLSGGQRQRVALGRVLAGDPSLLLLDDPLASVDVAREESILGTLEEAGQGKTVLIVSQRVSAFKDCAILLYLEEGRLVECDRPEVLLARPSRYRHLVMMQSGTVVAGDGEVTGEST